MTKRSFNTKIFYTAALITGCCFVLSCENTDTEIKKWTDRAVLKEEAIQVESFLSTDGKMKAKLTAPLMERVTTPDTIYVEFPNTLHVDFYEDSTNNIQTILDSRYGKYLENHC